MDNTSQQRALRNYRTRLAERGLARFEVLGRDADRDLIRSLARRLAEDGPDSIQLRRTVSGAVAPMPPSRGRVLASLRQSPLVGSGIEIAKTRHPGRDVDL
jgi:hypothetical protein